MIARKWGIASLKAQRPLAMISRISTRALTTQRKPLQLLIIPQISLFLGFLEAGPSVTSLTWEPRILSDRIYFVFCMLPGEEERAKTTLVVPVIQRETEA